MYDIIVIGGGPAGMTAALYAQRNGKNTLVLEKHGFGGQITYSPKVENIPGFESLSGNEFADRFMEQILSQGAEVELENAVSVEKTENGFIVRSEEGSEYEAKAVVIATGVRHRMLGLPGEEDFVGDGISFCAVCDGDFYSGKTVCVAGGGNSALQEAILLSGKCERVIMLQDMPVFTGEKKLQETLFTRDNVEKHVNVKITALLSENGRFTGVQAQDTQNGREFTVPCDGLFEAIGLIPENEAFKNVCSLNAWGYFDAGENCSATVSGVFVAGDCRSKTVRQVTTACADGAVAALAACRYIDSL